ncbi:hypothetical protein K8374_12035 [Pseudomonas sp. p1(2021b)]|uniref:hypothetical protein n=1 Tax=Pseudomonas sp. p1(2021b) TaxID=2874628 RepID=UPI001CCD1954|nr:hypothetical protein [Pseudomonas sp. p1(2021b)]UBM23142.1 hypothetical protein K8374_12035 [Pseudomonas sp. p1(2021b)]
MQRCTEQLKEVLGLGQVGEPGATELHNHIQVEVFTPIASDGGLRAHRTLHHYTDVISGHAELVGNVQTKPLVAALCRLPLGFTSSASIR